MKRLNALLLLVSSILDWLIIPQIPRSNTTRFLAHARTRGLAKAPFAKPWPLAKVPLVPMNGSFVPTYGTLVPMNGTFARSWPLAKAPFAPLGVPFAPSDEPKVQSGEPFVPTNELKALSDEPKVQSGEPFVPANELKAPSGEPIAPSIFLVVVVVAINKDQDKYKQLQQQQALPPLESIKPTGPLPRSRTTRSGQPAALRHPPPGLLDFVAGPWIPARIHSRDGPAGWAGSRQNPIKSLPVPEISLVGSFNTITGTAAIFRRCPATLSANCTGIIFRLPYNYRDRSPAHRPDPRPLQLTGLLYLNHGLAANDRVIQATIDAQNTGRPALAMKQISILANLIALLLLTTLATACASPAAAPPTPAPSGGPTVALDLSHSPAPSLAEPDPFAEQRAAMVQDGLIAWGITDPAVLQVMGQVPRHEFIPADMSHLAYQNHPLPIGYGQTISQPYIVALMTEALDVMTGDKVLEIGTGSGYQAAVLSRLVDRVYTIEIIDPLAQRAAEAHQRVGYGNITGRTADGYYGWPEEAPFDAIIVTAAPDHIPQPLVQQLRIGGRLVIPVGPIGGVQTLWLISRTGEESVQTKNLGDVRFVPFTRDPAAAEDDGLSGPAE